MRNDYNNLGGKHEAPSTEEGCILKKGAKMRMRFSSSTTGSKALVNLLMTFVFHKKGKQICHCPYHEGKWWGQEHTTINS
jgi:hypothetical protein